MMLIAQALASCQQKKNPDVCELVRGKTGRTYGHLLGLLTTLKGLPLTYNKDMQEDKEGIFDAIDTVHFALSINAGNDSWYEGQWGAYESCP